MIDSDFHQHTIRQPIHCTGIGVHGGRRVTMTILPAAVDHGIVFHRADICRDTTAERARVPARWDRVSDTRLCSVLSNGEGASVGTVEHIMAALAGCGIDNALISLDGPEVPIMDGSAAPFVFLLQCAGIAAQEGPRHVIRVLKPVEVAEGDGARVRLDPADEFSVDMTIDFPSPAIAQQHRHYRGYNGTFIDSIAEARTFGFLHEVEALRAAGLARGGSLDNAIVVAGDRIMNEGGLRYDDEFVRHKILDAVGDLYLAGAPLLARFTGHRSGHRHNNKVLAALFADETAYRVESAADLAGAPADRGDGYRQALARSA